MTWGKTSRFFVKQEAKRLRGLYEQRAREKDPFSIFFESSSLNTGAELKDETCTWLDLIYRRLSARRRIKRPWYLEFTRDIPKESFLALKRTFSTTTNLDLRGNVCMEGNRKGFSISIAYFPSVLYMFPILTGKTIEQCCVITVSVTHINFLCMTKFALSLCSHLTNRSRSERWTLTLPDWNKIIL